MRVAAQLHRDRATRRLRQIVRHQCGRAAVKRKRAGQHSAKPGRQQFGNAAIVACRQQCQGITFGAGLQAQRRTWAVLPRQSALFKTLGQLAAANQVICVSFHAAIVAKQTKKLCAKGLEMVTVAMPGFDPKGGTVPGLR